MTVLQSQTEVKYTPLIIFIPCSRVRRGKKPTLMSCTYPHSPYTIYRFTPRVINEDEDSLLFQSIQFSFHSSRTAAANLCSAWQASA